MENTYERQLAAQDVERLGLKPHSNLEEDLSFTPENIKDAFSSQAAKYAYWSVVTAQAKNALDRKKSEIDRQEEYIRKTLMSELDIVVRQKLAEESSTRVTEARVTSAIYTHLRYQEAQNKLYALQNELLDLQYQYNLLSAAKDAMIHRKDMLVSMGAQLRQEFSSD